MVVVPGGGIDNAARLERLIATLEPRLQRAFRLAINIILNGTTLGLLADLIEAGRIDEALARVDEAARALSTAQRDAVITSGRSAATSASEVLTVDISFDDTNRRALEAFQQNDLRLVREFSDGQRAATRAAIEEGIRDGINPRQQARRFRESIGLTETQTRAVANYRRLLTARANMTPSREVLNRALRDGRFDPSIERAIRTGVPLTEAQIDRMVERYRERYLRYRSEVIARTEALNAAHEGTELLWQQAIDEGQVAPQQLVRQWNTARDARVRESHTSLNGQRRPHGQPWISGFGNTLRFPGDPRAPASERVQCRCVLSTRIIPVEEAFGDAGPAILPEDSGVGPSVIVESVITERDAP